MIIEYKWSGIGEVVRKSFVCGYCGHTVGQDRGYSAKASTGHVAQIYPCPNCTMPTFFAHGGDQTPSVRLGRDVTGIDNKEVQTLYNEARDCTSVGAYTGAILLCRKILMNIAVQHKAVEGKTFVYYIDFLNDKGYVPPNGKIWIDEIRKKGNEATHETPSPKKEDADQILNFVEMLLRFVYEFPSMVQSKSSPEQAD